MAALLWSSRVAMRGKWAVGAAVLGLTGLLLLGVSIALLVLGVSIAWDTGWEWLLAASQLVALGTVPSGAGECHRRRHHKWVVFR